MTLPPTNAILLALAAALLLGCGGDDETPPTADVAYYGDVEVLMQEHCRGCHEVDGVAPFALDSYDTVSSFAAASLAAMDAGQMPPWLPDPACNSYENDRVIPSDDIERFRAWVDTATPEGDPAAAVPYAPPVLDLDATHSAQVPGYVSSAEEADDYRCFLLDELTFSEELYLTGSQIVPGSPQVHHVLVYAMDPSLRPELEARDAAEEGDGYTCFGGPVEFGEEGGSGFANGFPNQISGWVPGQSAQELPEDMGVRILPGSVIVVQVHYSYLAGAPEADNTELQVRLTDQPPSTLVATRPLVVNDLDIPAGEANVAHGKRYTNYSDEPVNVRQIAAHMHLLGTELTAIKVPAMGSEEACLVDIPDWDFNWQQSYELEQQMVVEPGDAMDVTCVYDNTAANQPVINGVQQEPIDVSWGDGTLDEMCVLYMSVVEPYAPAPMMSATDCDAPCDCTTSPTVDCVLSCEEAAFGCHLCAFSAAVDCTSATCGTQLLAAEVCLNDCFVNALLMAGSPGRCLAAECATEYSALADCMDPTLTAGDCSQPLADCGL
jgi:Copper type II ascorbate-dependent monooxygenase, C-terminal domain